MERHAGHLRRRLTVFVSLLAALTLLVPLSARAEVAESSPAGMAAGWIAHEYNSPDSEIKLFGTGVLLDALISLAASGTESGVALDMLDDLSGQVAGYVGSGDTFNVGGAGKVLLVLAMYHQDVTEFVAFDLEAELRGTLQTSGDDEGRFGEAAVLNQAYAVLGLSTTDGGVPASAVSWLAGTQCPSGEFTFDGACPGLTDADTTGIAALALLVAGDTTTAGVSVTWLKSIQNPDGSIPGYGTPNSNSTAAAAVAFVAGGETDAATAAADYLASMQFPQSAGIRDRGGLKWIDSDTTANTFATVQGVWGMGVPALHLVTAPTFEFSDTAGTVFEREITWLAAADITRGCNPPVNDGFCPRDPVTRGEMAAFLHRAFDLPDATDSGFVDVAASIFAGDIAAIAGVGITRGCNPPANDRFCPDDLVTRGQMAAFLNRVLVLDPASGSGFVDTAGSEFSNDIEAIAAAGITRGCNPPDNDRFCPEDYVTREQMAALIFRSLHS